MDLLRCYPAVASCSEHGVTLDDVDRCARPIHFELDDDVFQYGGNGSSFIAVADQTWMLFTANHVLGNADANSICVAPCDRSRRWLSFKRRVRMGSLVEGDTDLSDVAALTIDTSRMNTSHGDVLHGVDLAFPTATPRAGDELIITGYPRASRHVDYEGRGIIAIGQRIGAKYLGNGIGARCHEIELTQIGNLRGFDGFSGSPVYSVGGWDGDLVTVRLAGMMLRGNAGSRRAHYLEAAVLQTMAETAITGRPAHLSLSDGRRARPSPSAS